MFRSFFLCFCHLYDKILRRGVVYIIFIIVHSIAMTSIMLSSFYIFMKSIQCDITMFRKITTIMWCLLLGVLYGVAPLLMPVFLFRPIACAASIIFILFLIKPKLEVAVSAYLFSFGISLSLYYVATALISFFTMFLLSKEHTPGTPLDYNKPVYILIHSLIFIVQIILSFAFFRIRRFRKGFPFIFNKLAIVMALFFTGIILILVTWVNMASQSEKHANIGYSLYLIGVLIGGIGIYILIRRLIKVFQRKKVQQNATEYFEKLWLEEKRDKERALELIKNQSSIIHNFADRIQSMENSVLEQDSNILLEDVRNLKKDLQNKMATYKGNQILPSTNNRIIDNLFEYFAKQFSEGNIDFNIMINGSIKYMVDNVIEQSELETLIVNHLKDAQIAVNASDNSLRRITVAIGLSEGFYEFTVFDSGIPFEIDTLIQLGKNRITTHANTGGSGIGFETTFNILKEYGASLIINEQEQSKIDYSKSVSIRFDSKNQYVLKTYRSADFPTSERYVVVS